MLLTVNYLPDSTGFQLHRASGESGERCLIVAAFDSMLCAGKRHLPEFENKLLGGIISMSKTKSSLTAMPIDIGIEENDRREIAQGLSRMLADTYTLYLKTHNFHWNVTGPMFQTLHLMFEGQYTELSSAVDLIAERIRALGFPAPATYKQFTELTSITEIEGTQTLRT
ncbi:MAG: Dps family protein [Pyrinomonadaceae bacterium]